MTSWDEIIKRLRSIGLSDWEIQCILEDPYKYLEYVKDLTLRQAAAKSIDHFINNYKGIKKPKSIISSIIEHLQTLNEKRMKKELRTSAHKKRQKTKEEEKEKKAKEEEEVMIVKVRKELV